MESIAYYANNPTEFKLLEFEQQLMLIADIIYYYAKKKTDALRTAGKSRTDACIDAAEWEDLEKYWSGLQTNIRRLASLEEMKIQRGL